MLTDVATDLKLLALLVSANAGPVIATGIFGHHLRTALDGGVTFIDGHPILGKSKTIRGLVASLVATVLVGVMLDVPLRLAALIAGLAMLGDAVTSFVKRRLALPASSRVVGFDQVPESLLPLLAVQGLLGLNAWDIVSVTLAFVLLDTLLSPFLFRIHIRRQPH